MNKSSVYLVGYYTQDLLCHYLGVFSSLEKARFLRNALSDAGIDRPFLICTSFIDGNVCLKPTEPRSRSRKLPF